MRRPITTAALLLVLAVAGGCTRESVRVAVATQRRADDVSAAVFERQHEALCILLYRDAAARLAAGGAPLTEAQWAALSEVWNDRDLIEFWALQYERARALRLAGVDAQLWSQQSVADLLWKECTARADRAAAGLASAAGERAAQPPAPESRDWHGPGGTAEPGRGPEGKP